MKRVFLALALAGALAACQTTSTGPSKAEQDIATAKFCLDEDKAVREANANWANLTRAQQLAVLERQKKADATCRSK